ncbi:MAG: glycosyltransferase family 4 protein [Ruminococcaceae bacterium]|nr:glycosyltransferase family 4 protein [Oscillospiraceae bacterium]
MMKNKKIAFFIDSLGGGGAERVVSVLSNELYSREYDIDILMLNRRPVAYPLPEGITLYIAEDMPVTTTWGKLARKFLNRCMHLQVRFLNPLLRKFGCTTYPKVNETRMYFYANYALPYREYLKNNKDCTAFGFLIRSNIAMLMAAKGISVKTVFCERNNPVRPDMPRNIMKIRDGIYRCCKAAVFQTEDERAYYTKLRCESAVIPNPLKEGLPQPFTGERRHEIVNFCRLNKQKNIPLLIDAFEMLLAEYPDYTLRIYGRGEEKDSLIALTKEKGLEKSVFFEDFASDVHERIRDAAMYVCSSDFEGLSNSMLEALAIGLPCVCTDCHGGGARMMISGHKNGILTPIGDVQALYNGMKEIIENPALAQHLSGEAAKVRDELSIERIADRWEAII